MLLGTCIFDLDQKYIMLYFILIMTWDWEKLQEKKERQEKPRIEPDNDSGKDSSGFDLLGDAMGKLQKKWLSYLIMILLALFLMWLSTGLYSIGANNVGLVLRFGLFTGEEKGPGSHFHWPYPIEKVVVINTIDKVSAPDIDALFITKDGQLINVKCSAKYKISSPSKYLFSATDHVQRLKHIAESSIFNLVGHQYLDVILALGADKLQGLIYEDAQQKIKSQDIGIELFELQILNANVPMEVLKSAKKTQNALIENKKMLAEAKQFKIAILKDAELEAQNMIKEAQKYSVVLAQRTEAEIKNMAVVAPEYLKNKAFFSLRLYFETIEKSLTHRELLQNASIKDSLNKQAVLSEENNVEEKANDKGKEKVSPKAVGASVISPKAIGSDVVKTQGGVK